ncbi:DUF1307 domain-containing protein [Streptococcus panodentis]|uniref:Lipoprotein YehR n=1 Tax=Streptococcus panodentis TaxID=1581472 RepID=A0ABS5AUT7_9STRE|nr:MULTISPECIES: DUF1307 domain-containing protein [Streptococcus]KXT84902.1 putative lipoprotein [Streptococcus sp. DD11]MBP2620226.1 hypothetical protein [Streptococcus panodentis]
MKKNAIKTLFLSFVAVFSLFLLAACGSSTKKGYFQYIDKTSMRDSRITVTYQGDKVTTNETTNIVYYESSGMTKEDVKEQTDSYANLLKGIKGVSYKVEYKNDYAQEKLSIDFSKANIKELQSKNLIETSGNQEADYISYKETQKLLKNTGYSEVKDGKFENLE